MSSHYMSVISNLLDDLKEKNQGTVDRVSARIAHSVSEGGVVHLFGSGHSHMVVEDTFHRAGGLACVNAMLEESLMELNFGRSTQLERLTGYGAIILSGYDVREDEVIVVISNSGINPVPVEIALEAKKKGLFVVAITSRQHSQSVQSRHPSGRRLFEIADEVLDSCTAYGDVVMECNGNKFGPTSTVAGMVIIQWVMTTVIEKLIQRGIDPPVFISANTPEGDSHNIHLRDRYRNRIRYYQ